MKWRCVACKQQFRRFSAGPGVCPKCKFVPDYEEAEDDYWDFQPVFELRKWLRRRVKVLVRSVFGPKSEYHFGPFQFVGKVPPQEPFKYRVTKKSQ